VQSLVDFRDYNPFAKLQDASNQETHQEEEMEEERNNAEIPGHSKDNQNNQDQQSSPTTKSKPPPLYIYGIQNKYTFTRTVLKGLQENPKIFPSGDGMLMHFRNYADYEKIKTYCEQAKVQHATGTPREDRPIRAVIWNICVTWSGTWGWEVWKV